jgi:hypothetical protein
MQLEICGSVLTFRTFGVIWFHLTFLFSYLSDSVDWLFGYEQYKLSQLYNKYDGVGMSVDYDKQEFIFKNEQQSVALMFC